MAEVRRAARALSRGLRRGLDKGFFFVARTHSAVEPAFADGVARDGAVAQAGGLPLRPRRQALSPRHRHRRARLRHRPRARRQVADVPGRAAAAPRGRHRQLRRSARGRDRSGDAGDVGPFTQKGRYDQVGLGSNASGQPMFTFVVDQRRHRPPTRIDTAHTGARPSSRAAASSPTVARPARGPTRWRTSTTRRCRASRSRTARPSSSSRVSITGDRGAPAGAELARPGRRRKARLTYAGKLDACKILKGESKDKNELYVYDKKKRTAQRIAAAVSPFETLWLDDDRLVYEGGVGKDGKIHLYTFATHADERAAHAHGAGLYGVPTLACEQAESGIDEDIGEEESHGRLDARLEIAAVEVDGRRCARRRWRGRRRRRQRCSSSATAPMPDRRPRRRSRRGRRRSTSPEARR